MLARLILALLLAAFAVPAAAAGGCHDASATEHAMPGMPDMPVTPDREAVAAHVCIGCIPPGNWQGADTSADVRETVMTPAARVARLDLGAGWPPATPPPRRG